MHRSTTLVAFAAIVFFVAFAQGCDTPREFSPKEPGIEAADCPEPETREVRVQVKNPMCGLYELHLNHCRRDLDQCESSGHSQLLHCSDVFSEMEEGPVRDLVHAMTGRLDRETVFAALCHKPGFHGKWHGCDTTEYKPAYPPPPLVMPMPRTYDHWYITYNGGDQCAVEFIETWHPGHEDHYPWAPLAQLAVRVVNTWQSGGGDHGALQLLYGNIYDGSALDTMGDDGILYSKFLSKKRRAVLTVIHDEDRLRTFAPWAIGHIDLLSPYAKYSVAGRINSLLTGSYPNSEYAVGLFVHNTPVRSSWDFLSWGAFEERIRHEDAHDTKFIWKTGQKLKAWWLRRWIATGRGQKGTDHLVLLRYWAWEVLMLTDPVLADEWQPRILAEMRGTRTLRHKVEYMKALQR